MDIRKAPALHGYHLVDLSPWPFVMSLAFLNLAINLISWFNHLSHHFGAAFLFIALILVQWWRDVVRESKSGYHTNIVNNGLLIGFILFLVSEIMLFFSFFWAFFHSSLSPTFSLGCIWPPVGVESVNCWSIPLLGTLLLLSSGFVFTLSHHALITGNKSLTIISLFWSFILGVLFLILQGCEYYYTQFTISDSVYGSVFYLTTGLHAIHVFAGLAFIFVALIRLRLDHLTLSHHINFEFAGAYWHLVDIVWLFVFLTYYWWGGVHLSSSFITPLSPL